ncbi:Peptidase family M28 [Olivibacter domesticus]|uniref:Peptidase family M28 n=1 Tax=Olivibacter domesticus TaxID=407022 RepID=A0A1H7ZSJ4_OLID1|nr:Peptidase family M28 [Olivibacter domesticus]SEM61410.1 Peptidase family M28 [Olivibacter domesticus]
MCDFLFTKQTFLRITLFNFFVFYSLGSLSAQEISTYAHAELIKKHINNLAADKMKGRGTGSREINRAAKYIEKYFEKYKLKPLGSKGYKQPFIAKVTKVVVKDSLRKANNLIGFLDNNAPYTIIVGAHYDHLGLGKQGSSKDSLPEGKIHNGADDNASGVAGLLELARYFSQNDVKENLNILFIAFSGEELGLLGSKYYVNHPVIPLDKISFMLNMDMIGRYNAERGVGVGGFGTSDKWPSIFEGVETDVKFFTDNAGSGGSDHGSFYAKGIPVLFFHTGDHPDYHKPSDTSEKIDSESEAKIIDFEIRLLLNGMKENKLNFTKVN